MDGTGSDLEGGEDDEDSPTTRLLNAAADNEP